MLSLATLRIRHRGVNVLVWPRITADRRHWANQLEHEDDGVGQELLAIEGTGQTN